MSTLYDILELSPSATPEDIRSAFRRLSKQYHPDVNEDAAWSELQFKELNHAYQILSDPALRREYDQSVPVPENKKKYKQRSSEQRSNNTRRRRASHAPPQRQSPYRGFFLLLGIAAIFLLAKMYNQERSRYEIPLLPKERYGYEKVDPVQVRERLELLYLYQEFPQLFLSEDARQLSKASLPTDFASDLKCFLMEGDTAGFNRLIRKVVERNEK